MGSNKILAHPKSAHVWNSQLWIKFVEPSDVGQSSADCRLGQRINSASTLKSAQCSGAAWPSSIEYRASSIFSSRLSACQQNSEWLLDFTFFFPPEAKIGGEKKKDPRSDPSGVSGRAEKRRKGSFLSRFSRISRRFSSSNTSLTFF